MQTAILAMVDMDCDGPTTCFYRVRFPATINRHDDAGIAQYAMDSNQMTKGDPSEWFVYDEQNYSYRPQFRFREGVYYDYRKGNCFQ